MEKSKQGKSFLFLQEYYESIAKRATDNNATIDIFAGCLDQVGLMEMKSLVNLTNGVIILSDSFNTNIFKQSFHAIFNKDDDGFLKMGFNANLEVLTSRELKVSGLIGAAISNAKKTPNIGDTEIGISGTSSWKFCSLTPGSNFGIYFEVAAQQQPQPGTFGMIQFITNYVHACGQTRLRVTTIGRRWADANAPEIPGSFDQEAAAVLMSRIAAFKSENDDGPDVLRWLDRMLIRLCQRFARYAKDDPNSFDLAPNFSIYPQFMFHLRRSQFLQVFNNSPDETAFYRHMLNGEDVNNSLIMIQPTLMRFSFDEAPSPVLLDSISIQGNVILLLDTFFHVLIWHGETIAAWRKAKYHEDPNYANFKELLEAPQAEAQVIMQNLIKKGID